MEITETNYVDKAEKVLQNLKNKTKQKGSREEMVTTSKLRNLLAMTADIYNEVVQLQNDTLDEETKGRIDYLRVRFIYECGREQKVKDFVEEAGLIQVLKEIQGSRKNFLLYVRYMESLVAFHRFYDGKE